MSCFDAGGFSLFVEAMGPSTSSLRNLTTLRMECPGVLGDPDMAGLLGQQLFLLGACPKLEELYIGGEKKMGAAGLAAFCKPLLSDDFVDEDGVKVEPVARRPLRALRLSGCGMDEPGLRTLITAMERGRGGVLSQLESLDIGHNPALGDEGLMTLVQRATVARTEAQARSGFVADWAGRLTELVLDDAGISKRGPGLRSLAQGLRDPGIFPRLRELWIQRSEYCFALEDDEAKLLMDAVAEGRAAGTRSQGLSVPGVEEIEVRGEFDYVHRKRPRYGWAETAF